MQSFFHLVLESVDSLKHSSQLTYLDDVYSHLHCNFMLTPILVCFLFDPPETVEEKKRMERILCDIGVDSSSCENFVSPGNDINENKRSEIATR